MLEFYQLLTLKDLRIIFFLNSALVIIKTVSLKSKSDYPPYQQSDRTTAGLSVLS